MPSRDTPKTGRKIQALSRTAFCVSGRDGDIRPSGEMGHFHRDTRHLSEFSLTVDGETPKLLSSHSDDEGAAFFMTSGESLSVMRKRRLPAYSGGLIESVEITNHARKDVKVTLDIHLDADFADLFEVRGVVPERDRRIEHRTETDALVFSYRRDDFYRETRITLETDSVFEVSASGFSVVVTLPPRSETTLKLNIEVSGGEESVIPVASETTEPPRLITSDDDLKRLWDRSIADLESLRFRPDASESAEVYAAGVPWYAALFGRDSLITCYQTLPLGLERTMDTLRLLAKYQGREVDAFRDEEPGRIPHELRLGEATHFEEVPFSPYYGTTDATPLFLIVAHELWCWTDAADFIREMEPHARRALDWIEKYANADGYIAYSPNPAGLVNQGWKDSDDSLLYADGNLAKPAISLCEVQGYAFDAYVRTAELAEKVWGDEGLARHLRDGAADLAARFDRDFWMEGRDCYALALDGDGRQVDSVTSNAGHLLWSGIVPNDRAGRLARTLMSPESFGGWGLRTMDSTGCGFDPVSYHNGSVWPHDNSLVAHGLARYGFRDEANRVAIALIEASRHFDYRLPEVFAGYDRDDTRFPVEYPTSCSPQAWAAGTVVLLVRTMLGLEPEFGALTLDPALPESISSLRIEDVPAFGTLHDVGI